MNLLTAYWIPVKHENITKYLNLQDVLCTEDTWEVSCPRDDFELAALQLLICLTQVIFLPKNATELKKREKTPLTEKEYIEGIKPFITWFDLLHPTQPFMQNRNVKAEEVTPIQKLFIGLPEGNNHVFFGNVGRIKQVGLPYAAIALFNQANNCPSFGGGFKGSLRGGAPLTTLIKGGTLRKTIWMNVLHQEFMEQQGCQYSEQDKPVWIEPIKANEKIYPHQIGLMRGLFWQPAHIDLQIQEGNAICDISGQHVRESVTGFNKERFSYEITEPWLHPHSPRSWVEKKGQQEKKYASFTTTAPAWTKLTNYLLTGENKKGGYSPALTVTQYSQVFIGQPLTLIVGGYRNNQAAVLERRHEMIGLMEGWENNTQIIQNFVQLALEVKKLLRGQVYGFGKNIGLEGLSEQAEKRFYQDSETLIHQTLREMNWTEAKEYYQWFLKSLFKIAHNTFEEVTYPYQREPKMLHALANARRFLKIGLHKLKEVA